MPREIKKKSNNKVSAGNSGGFDRIFLLAGTADQRTLLERLSAAVLRPYGSTVQVLSDSPGGKRIGSGGAVLRALLEHGTDVETQRIMMINCGGMSRRSANYSFCTKGMIPVGRTAEGGTDVCLANILRNAAELSKRMDPGLLVCCSDILIDTSEFEGELVENTSFCVKSPIEAGTRHGVMLPDRDGMLVNYFQKATEQTLRTFFPEFHMWRVSLLKPDGHIFPRQRRLC